MSDYGRMLFNCKYPKILKVTIFLFYTMGEGEPSVLIVSD